MKKIGIPIVIGLLLLGAIGLVFSLTRGSGSSDANGDNTLIPKPRAGSPTFAMDPAAAEVAKNKGRKMPDAPPSGGNTSGGQ